MTATITLTVTAPLDCTEQEFIQWLRFELNMGSGIALSNPLYWYEVETKDVSIKIEGKPC